MRIPALSLSLCLVLLAAGACGPSGTGSPAAPPPAPAAAPATAEPLSAPAVVARRAVPQEHPELSLDGEWQVLSDPDDRGRDAGLVRADHPAWEQSWSVAVPGPFESHPRLAGYDGVVWYRRGLPALTASPGEHLLLRFDAANQRADVWLGGEWLGRHDGADAPFEFDVTGKLDAPGTPLVVRVVDPGDTPVDGLVLGARPHAKESWYFNYGGLTGGVALRRAPAVEAVRAGLRLEGRGADERVLAWVELVNHAAAPRAVQLELNLDAEGAPLATSLEAQAAPGVTRLEQPLGPGAAALPRWSPDTPHLFGLDITLRAAPAAADAPDAPALLGRWHQPVGLRRFEVVGDHFELNGAALYLRGVLFQPYWPRTLTAPPDAGFLRRELQAIKDAGFNLVRAHIRDMPEIYAACDELGLLVQAEPTLGWITAWDAQTLPVTHRALQALAGDVDTHPSVVMVGLLNELSGLMSRHAAELMQVTRQLLPDHLLLEDSGSWMGSSHYLNPGAREPVAFDDLHVYRAWPWDAGDRRHVEGLGAAEAEAGAEPRLVFVSEYGYGGIPSFVGNLAGFGDELHFEDAQVYARQLADAQAPFDAGDPAVLGLVPDLATLTALGQANQAEAADFMARALRSNPRIAGDVYTQWRDVAWEDGAGLADVWGRPKPALAAMAALNAQAERPAPPWDELDPAAAMFGNGLRLTFQGELLGLDDAVEAQVRSAYTEDSGPHLIVAGVRNTMWSEKNIHTTVSVLRWVHQGGTALLLDPPRAGSPMDVDMFGYDSYGAVADLPLDVSVRSARGHFVGTHLIFAPDSPLTMGMSDDRRLFDRKYAAVRPRQALRVQSTDGLDIELGVFDGYGLLIGGIVQVVPYGQGHLILSMLPFEGDSLEDPVARGLLSNLVDLAARVASTKPTPPIREWVTVPAEASKAIGRLLWRHRVYFCLAERLAYQSFNGVRPERRDLEDLAAVVANKNAGLDLIIAGDYDGGIERLKSIDAGPLEGDRDAFLRAELRLAQEYRAMTFTAPLSERLAVARLHGRALAAMRSGHLDQALTLLAEGSALVAEMIAAQPAEG